MRMSHLAVTTVALVSLLHLVPLALGTLGTTANFANGVLTLTLPAATTTLTATQLAALGLGGLGLAAAAGLGAVALAGKAGGGGGGGSTATSYGAPSSGYGEPSSGYGAPSSSYGAPSSGHGSSSGYSAPSSSHHGRSAHARRKPDKYAYSQMVRNLNQRGKREAVQVDLEQVFQEVAAMDAADCAKSYVCQLATSPATHLTQRDKDTINMFGPGVKRGSPGSASEAYFEAWNKGLEAKDEEFCKETYSRCPLPDISSLVNDDKVVQKK